VPHISGPVRFNGDGTVFYWEPCSSSRLGCCNACQLPVETCSGGALLFTRSLVPPSSGSNLVSTWLSGVGSGRCIRSTWTPSHDGTGVRTDHDLLPAVRGLVEGGKIRYEWADDKGGGLYLTGEFIDLVPTRGRPGT
jgi:hypothetical protein